MPKVSCENGTKSYACAGSHENTNAVVWNQEFAGLVVLEDLLVLEGLGRQGARLSGAGVTRTG
ncbi:MAG TPA: hypothetical protein VIY49_31455, partial [Bryobacteraceae bacterium]